MNFFKGQILYDSTQKKCDVYLLIKKIENKKHEKLDSWYMFGDLNNAHLKLKKLAVYSNSDFTLA